MGWWAEGPIENADDLQPASTNAGLPFLTCATAVT
jgi:hypothetical protein